MVTNKLASRSRQVTSDVSSPQAESVSPGKISPIDPPAYPQENSSAFAGVQAFPKTERLSVDSASKQQGCGSGITHPETLHFIAGGLDWLKLWAFGRCVTSDEFQRLEKLRDRAQESDRPVYHVMAGMVWTVQPRGVSRASNYMPVALTCAGLTVAFCQREGSGPVAMIEAEGSYCGGRDPQELYRELKRIISQCGVAASHFKISRMDIYGDMGGIHISSVIRAFANDNVVKRSRKWKLEGEGMFKNVQGVYFGRRGHLMCRIYDKAKQVAADPDDEKAYLIRSGLQQMPQKCTRTEFQIHSEAINELWPGMNADEVFASLATLTEYLMQEWLRVCSHVDHNHTDRAKPVAWWQYLGRKMAQAVKGVLPRPAIVTPLPKVNKLLKGLKGYLTSIYGRLGLAPSTVQDGLSGLSDYFNEADNESFRDGIERKVVEFDQRAEQYVQLAKQAEKNRVNVRDIIPELCPT